MFLIIETLVGAGLVQLILSESHISNAWCERVEFIKTAHYWIMTQFAQTITLLTQIVEANLFVAWQRSVFHFAIRSN